MSQIQTKTTYPPIVYFVPDVYFYTNLSLNPQAQRDTNALVDLGYHYDPLDYIFGPIFITNATITVNAGTAIGIFSTNTFTYGIAAADNGNLFFQGTANALTRIMEYNVVQEQTPAGWRIPSYGLVTHFYGTGATIGYRFTDSSVMAQDAPHFQVSGDVGLAPVNIQNSQFHGGLMYSMQPTINFTNCLLERVNADIEPDGGINSNIRNNLFVGGTFGFGTWNVNTNNIISDNLFDHTVIPEWMDGVYTSYIGAHNGYVTNCDRLYPPYGSDVILSASPAYQTGPLGTFYLPSSTPLINAGSTTADQVGLYHFTTQTNQVKEANTVVDIGYHYVATDANGNPIDSNGDDIPDYIQDANGNGVIDSGEPVWNNLSVLITRPNNGSLMP